MRRPVSTLGCEEAVEVVVSVGVVGDVVLPDAPDDSEPGAAEVIPVPKMTEQAEPPGAMRAWLPNQPGLTSRE